LGCDVICFWPKGAKVSGEYSASFFVVEEGILLRWRHHIPLIVGTYQTTWCYIPADYNHNTHCKVNLSLYFLLLLYGWHEACMSALSVSVDKHHLYSSLQDYICTCCLYFISIMFCAVKFVPSVVGFVCFISSGFLSVIVLSTSTVICCSLYLSAMSSAYRCWQVALELNVGESSWKWGSISNAPHYIIL